MRALFQLRVPLEKRFFSSGFVLGKDEKSKQLLEKLGMSLQKGNIKSKDSDEQEETHSHLAAKADVDEKNEITNTKKPESFDERKEMLNQVKDCFNSISHMTVNDIMIQKNLDEGMQFSFPSEHYLDRKKLIDSLPDEIDIFNTPLSVIERTYNDLAKLDNDKSVHLKYYKRYLQNYNDPINNLIQEFNGISEKFMLLRRREIDSLSLATGAYLYKENMFGNPYNVIGFDRSISGLPLRTGKHKLTDKCYPQEFIEDLQMFRTKIPVHKRDLDFIEYEENSVNIDPSRIENSKEKPRDFQSTLNSIYQELEVPKNSILVDSLADYKMLTFKSDIVIRIENEILFMKRSLQQEIELFMKSNGNRLLLFNHQDLKHSQFRLCETKHPENVNSSLIIVNYNLKPFNIIPNYSILLTSRSQRKKLENHLFKIFLINMEDQIDTLFRIKYYDEKDMKKFMKSVSRNIRRTISFKLLKFFTPFKDEEYRNYDAFIYKPQLGLAFKRLYRLRSWKISTQSERRKPLNMNLGNFEDISER
ncbi:uncharacterized protein PRCAT00006077001 [Priceomyces carsonii]|uniref:uncharacterized protein n=1 Tax=Priceomyces carsonii TaxID=28549 RepID=UPI002EDA2FE4|nr:unnamed protein product [Priceomyces carsonii]